MNREVSSHLREVIIDRLREVIDPETNADVVRMQLIKDLQVHHWGQVRYTFQPSSALCPLAVFLITQIKQAIAQVPGVTTQEIRIEGYIAKDELTKLINEEV